MQPQPIPCSIPIVLALSAIANQHRVLLISVAPEPSLQPRAANEAGKDIRAPGFGVSAKEKRQSPLNIDQRPPQLRCSPDASLLSCHQELRSSQGPGSSELPQGLGADPLLPQSLTADS